MDLVTCPECGGVIGGDGSDGRSVCHCGEDQPATGPRPGMPQPKEIAKVCCKCGKDLANKKRFKDSLGYWCEACHFSDKKSQVGNQVPCDSCGRYLEPNKLIDYENIRICSRCLRDRQHAAKKAKRPVVMAQAYNSYEKMRLLPLLLIIAILIAIIILAKYGLL